MLKKVRIERMKALGKMSTAISASSRIHVCNGHHCFILPHHYLTSSHGSRFLFKYFKKQEIRKKEIQKRYNNEKGKDKSWPLSEPWTRVLR
ncbi:hypothetical protein H6P81_011606 [Aristolochia fimbriata]|uniref:Uncharacterized protein n=1 Tax=Aristolochia fimbriata TaxID=158543 RepID=A0AAV7ET52_ARIFI|nr:hypothetical protein H6P81_011606 [Aristolochia fimbriata]